MICYIYNISIFPLKCFTLNYIIVSKDLYYVNEAFNHLKEYEERNLNNKNSDERKVFKLNCQKCIKIPDNHHNRKEISSKSYKNELNGESIAQKLRNNSNVDYSQKLYANYFSNQDSKHRNLSINYLIEIYEILYQIINVFNNHFKIGWEDDCKIVMSKSPSDNSLLI